MNGKSPRQVAEQSVEAMSGTPAMMAFEAWLSFNKPMAAAMSEISGRVLEQVSRANSEVMGFINRRLNEDLAMSQKLIECRSMPDFMTAYSEYLQTAQQQYQTELQYFARLNQKLAEDATNVVKSRVEEVGQELRH